MLDKEIADAASQTGFWQGAAGYATSLLSLLTAWAWTHTHSLLKDKAEAETVRALAEEVKNKISTNVMDGFVIRVETAFKNQREDNQKIFGLIQSTTENHARFTEKVIEELGRRPTRDECSKLCPYRGTNHQ